MLNDTGIEDGNHALLVGEILGLLLKQPSLYALPIIVDGDYTNEIRVRKPSGTYIVAIYPERED